ncbi:uncharacterized protein LOC126880906 [Diabrotica virgifera virgifera]|uniref:Uncharacterized protein n=1 Tax=Diabrotica virgifera virgifera TaxID=50390 RepID=A0ABM5JSL7_DIAVI|nr:uncharacterized protein LOC126880906 [Diabrotica virgifera virgifera]
MFAVGNNWKGHSPKNSRGKCKCIKLSVDLELYGLITLQIQKYNEQKVLDQLKRDQTADKKDILATGGGTFIPRLTYVGAQMLSLIGNQIQPLPNSCDSASGFFTSDESLLY